MMKASRGKLPGPQLAPIRSMKDPSGHVSHWFPLIGSMLPLMTCPHFPHTEEYDVDLRDVTVLELRILPDQSGGAARPAHRSPVCVWPDKSSLAVAEPERGKKGTNNG